MSSQVRPPNFLDLITSIYPLPNFFRTSDLITSKYHPLHPPRIETCGELQHCGELAIYGKATVSYLVSTHILCERPSVMQELARLREFFAHFGRTPYSAQGNPSPSQPGLELLMEDFKKFGAEAGRIAPPLPKKTSRLCAVYVCVETSRCIAHGYHLVVYLLHSK